MNRSMVQALLLDLERQVGVGKIDQLVIKGRREAVISCTVPDGPVPKGWRRVNELPLQQVEGYQRIVVAARGW